MCNIITYVIKPGGSNTSLPIYIQKKTYYIY